MASTYSPLKIELIGTGEQDGTWGDTTNTNLGTAIEQAITGSGDVTFSSADVTLTLSNTNAAQTARNLRLVLIGVSGGARQLIVPAIEKQYIVKNELADTVTVKNSSGTGIAVPSGKTVVVFNDGTNVVDVTTYASSMALGGTLTGTTATFSGAISSVSPAFTGTPTAPTAALGTNTTQIATTAFTLANSVPSGVILLWSGSIASIPAGYFLCDGTNSTPDLRNRFIVGAGSTYAVDATGGSADAIVVSHTHTATSTVTDPGHFHETFGNAGSGSFPAGTFNCSAVARSNGTNTDGPSTTKTTGITVATTNANAGTSGTNANLPPYYALAYIMKA
jgi:hypothetical protein